MLQKPGVLGKGLLKKTFGSKFGGSLKKKPKQVGVLGKGFKKSTKNQLKKIKP